MGSNKSRPLETHKRPNNIELFAPTIKRNVDETLIGRGTVSCFDTFSYGSGDSRRIETRLCGELKCERLENLDGTVITVVWYEKDRVVENFFLDGQIYYSKETYVKGNIFEKWLSDEKLVALRTTKNGKISYVMKIFPNRRREEHWKDGVLEKISVSYLH